MPQPTYGIKTNYRIGIRTQSSVGCLIQFTNTGSEAQAERLVGRRVAWKSENRKRTGRIVGFHWKNGAVGVRSKQGIPGQLWKQLSNCLAKEIAHKKAKPQCRKCTGSARRWVQLSERVVSAK